MSNIVILYCKKIKDHSCVGCAKCFKAVEEKNGKFSHYDKINLISMTDCGDCPGLVIPRVKIVIETLKNINRKIDVIHLGTCIKVAMKTAKCPINPDVIKSHINQKFKIQTIIGTHEY